MRYIVYCLAFLLLPNIGMAWSTDICRVPPFPIPAKGESASAIARLSLTIANELVESTEVIVRAKVLEIKHPYVASIWRENFPPRTPLSSTQNQSDVFFASVVQGPEHLTNVEREALSAARKDAQEFHLSILEVLKGTVLPGSLVVKGGRLSGDGELAVGEEWLLLLHKSKYRRTTCDSFRLPNALALANDYNLTLLAVLRNAKAERVKSATKTVLSPSIIK